MTDQPRTPKSYVGGPTVQPAGNASCTASQAASRSVIPAGYVCRRRIVSRPVPSGRKLSFGLPSMLPEPQVASNQGEAPSS